MTPAIVFINHVLAQQGWACEKLKPHAGRSVRLTALPLDFTLVITPEGLVGEALQGSPADNGSHQGTQADDQRRSPSKSDPKHEPTHAPNSESQRESSASASRPPDVTLRIPLASLPLFALDPERAMKDVRIDGDAEFAQILSQLARELRWDAEEDLSRVTGDIAAHRLMQGARTMQTYAKDAAQRMAETTTAFLIDEDPVLVRKSMAEQFAREVSTLRDDCARLEKRLELLELKRRG